MIFCICCPVQGERVLDMYCTRSVSFKDFLSVTLLCTLKENLSDKKKVYQDLIENYSDSKSSACHLDPIPPTGDHKPALLHQPQVLAEEGA